MRIMTEDCIMYIVLYLVGIKEMYFNINTYKTMQYALAHMHFGKTCVFISYVLL